MQNRFDADTFVGGDVALMLMMKRYLERVGVRVDVSLELEPDVTPYDVVHVFNLVRVHEPYLQMRNAMRAGKRVVFSPIYDDFSELTPRARGRLSKLIFGLLGKGGYELAKGVALLTRRRLKARPLALQIAKGYRQLQKELVRGADLVLPLSQAEDEIITRLFGRHASRVCPIGLEPESFAEGTLPIDPERPFVLCVGLFSDRKNQLGLIRAMKGSGVPLILVGGPAPFYESYFDRCRGEAGSEVRFLDRLERRELVAMYRAAWVHALPSYWEAAGMSSLEAAWCGCNIVVGRCPPVEEYFGARAWVCDPASVESIREAVLGAIKAPRDGRGAGAHVRTWYTWELQANVLLGAYCK